MIQYIKCDVLIIGSGAAGLSLALSLPNNMNIAVLSKGNFSDTSTSWAQGGIAAVLDEEDTIESHTEDTLRAGVGLCHRNVVDFTVNRGREAIEWLVQQGVPFTHKEMPASKNNIPNSNFHLTREGGHSRRRIIHAADATGSAISSTLLSKVKGYSNIRLFQERVAIDLISHAQSSKSDLRCLGAYVLNSKTGNIEVFKSTFTVLATGGASRVYLHSTNPRGVSGDGIAMAWRAGCRVGNLEFNQFHPTYLYSKRSDVKTFLISEAVRGEGALLRLPDGSRFMHRFDPREELAPRDIVTRAINSEISRLNLSCVFLDITHKSRSFILAHFPTIHERCLQLSIDMTKELIPVIPAAHYTCGGIVVNKSSETDISNLYAIGETAFTGLHGANRMASNSLLECFVYARVAANKIKEKLRVGDSSLVSEPKFQINLNNDLDPGINLIKGITRRLQECMWSNMGAVRSKDGLVHAQEYIASLSNEIESIYRSHRINSSSIELRNLVQVAHLMIQSAIKRKESRGLHFISEYPTTLDKAVDSILIPVK